MRPCWWRACLGVVFVFGAAFGSAAQDAGVLIKTVPARPGELPDLVTAMGSIAPAVDGGLTIGALHDGRALALRVTPGERVTAGQPLIEFAASATVTSTYAQAANALSLAEAQRLHTQQLFQQQLATRDQLAQAEKAVRDAHAAVDALKAQGAGQSSQTLTAPFDGVVTTIAVAQGDRVLTGAPLLTVTRSDGFIATVGAELQDVPKIAAGQTARLTFIDGGKSVEGHVRRVDSVLNPKTRMVDVDIAIPPDAALSGQAVRASIQVGAIAGWRVPRSAVLTNADGAFLFQVAQGKAVRRNVQLMTSVGDEDLVRGALDAQAPIVTEGANQLDDGVAVRTAPDVRASPAQ
jgi:membrane fusion protein (multidrug efflux system)